MAYNEIVGGKDHKLAFTNEYNLGNVPDGTTWGYPGLIGEAKATHGLQVNPLTGLGSRAPQGWSKEGYVPGMSISVKAAGHMLHNLIEPHLKGSLNDNYSSQAWEIWKDDQGGYDGALFIAGLAKSLTITKASLSEALQIQLGLAGRYLQHTTTKTGTGGGSYKGFLGTSSNPLTIEHPQDDPVPWLGAHVRELVKYAGESAAYPAPIKSWSLSINRDIQPYMGHMTGADGQMYVVPRYFSWQKTTISMQMSMGAQDWDLWERSYKGELIDYLDLEITPPAAIGGASWKIRLSGGIVKPVDLDIKELAALDMPMVMEFKGASLI